MTTFYKVINPYTARCVGYVVAPSYRLALILANKRHPLDKPKVIAIN